MLLLHAAAVLFELVDDIFKSNIFIVDELFRPVHNAHIHAQAFANRKRVRAPGNADKQSVGRAESRNIELAAAVFDARSLEGISLELGIVRCRGYFRALEMQVFEHRHCKSRALDGVCARSELVYEHKTAVARLTHDIYNIRHMRRESRERLLYRLFVADVREDFAEHGKSASVARRNHKSAHRHEREKTDSLYRDGLAARVRTGYNERVKVRAEPYINGDYFVFVNERMAGGAQLYLAVGVE